MKKRRIIEIGAVLYKIFSSDTGSETYRRHYSDETFGEKVKRVAKLAGMKVIYPALLLQYMMKSDDVPLKAKLIISAGLGYFILPFDFIPDFAPVIGFVDDLGVMMLILRQMSLHVTPEIKAKARKQLYNWLGKTDEDQLVNLEAQIASGRR